MYFLFDGISTAGNEFSLLKEGIQKPPPKQTSAMVCSNCTNGNAKTLVEVRNGKSPSDSDTNDDADAKKAERWKPYAIVKLSVSGKVYVTLRKTLTFFPDTLLGSDEIEQYWNEEQGLYYFNRHRGVFNAILFFYQSRGIFRAPTNIEPDIMKEEMEFFKIDLVALLEVADPNAEDELEVKLSLREKLHTFLMDPQYSRAALYWSFADMIAIVVSIIMLVAESVPSASDYFENPDKSDVYYFLYSIEILVNGFFTVDFLLKLISWPKPWLFFKSPLNFLDFMAILPFYMELIAMMTSSGSTGGKFVVLRICRTSRVVRIFRFARHSKELLVVMKVVSGASREFAMLAMLIMVFVLLFGTLLYYSEMGYDSGYNSIPLGWLPWSQITIYISYSCTHSCMN